jgi:hypothetical protein
LADACDPSKSGRAKFLTLFTGKFLTPFDTECDFSRKVAPHWQALAVITAQKYSQK